MEIFIMKITLPIKFLDQQLPMQEIEEIMYI